MVVHVCLPSWFFLFLLISLLRQDYTTKLLNLQPLVRTYPFFPKLYMNLFYFFGKSYDFFFNSFVMLCRHVAWILVAALYHLPSFQSMGLDLRMNLSLFLTIYTSSVVFLFVFHVVFIGFWHLGLVSRVAKRRPAILTILQNCAVTTLSPNLVTIKKSLA